MPSPQLSTTQVDEQPSFDAALPSSQASLVCWIASPQLSTRQAALQPSFDWLLPSSQASLGVWTPSPQPSAHSLGSPSQDQPGSTSQTSSQPSPRSRLPSSQ